MTRRAEPLTDDRLARVLAAFLRAGVVLAAAIAAAGGIVFLRTSASDLPQFGEFRGAQSSISTIARTLQAARSGDGEALIQIGILALIATPVTRVLVSLFGFVRERNWTYVV